MENTNDKMFPNFDPTNDLSQSQGKQRRMKRGLGAKTIDGI